MAKKQKTKDQPIHLVCNVLRALLKKRTYTYHGDLKADLWAELRQLRIRAAVLEVDEAMTMVAANTPLIQLPPKPRLLLPDTLQSQPPMISRDEAKAVCQRLGTLPRR
jgi:hypothetical protein